jgi:hypothetical protein
MLFETPICCDKYQIIILDFLLFPPMFDMFCMNWETSLHYSLLQPAYHKNLCVLIPFSESFMLFHYLIVINFNVSS